MNAKNRYMLEQGNLNIRGYDWWWHSFTGYDEVTGEERQFFIEYYVINPGLGGEEPVFGQLEDNKTRLIKPSYAMIKAGSWGKGKKQLHNMYGITDFSYRHEPFRVQIGDNILENNFITGVVRVNEEEADRKELMTDAGKMSWNLMIYKDYSFDVGYGTSDVLKKQDMFEMYWHAEGLKSEYDGYVDFDGRRYIVEKGRSYGYQDKNFGSDYTNPWLWLSCCKLTYKNDDEILSDTCFDFGGGRPIVKGKALDGRILGVFIHEGKKYEYNFSKPWLKTKESFNCYEDGHYVYWHIKCQNRNSRVAVLFKALKEDLLLVNYENPDGLKLHNRLVNGGTAFGEVRLYDKVGNDYELVAEFSGTNGGCEYGEY